MTAFLAEYQAIIALALLLALFVIFALEIYPPEVTAAGMAALFIALGFVPTDQVMDVFSNSAPITIGAMFVISGALIRTGVLDAVANVVIAQAKSRPILALGVFLLVAVGASAFVNNTPVVLVLIPVVIRLAASLDLAPTRLLIPLSYVAILGGTWTLIGTSTNILVDGIVRESGMEGFSIFSIAPVGLAVTAAGLTTLLLLGPLLLPSRAASGVGEDESDFLSEVTILSSFAEVDTPLGAGSAFLRPGIRVTGVRRAGQIIRPDVKEIVPQAGDAIIVRAITSELLTLAETEGLRVGLRRGLRIEGDEKPQVVEAILTPASGGAGVRIADLSLHRGDGVRVLGAHRSKHVAGADLGSVRLRPADKLLLECTEDGLAALARSGNVVSITTPGGRAYRRRQAPIAIAALVGVVMLAALEIMPIGVLALIAVAAILILRCIDADEAWGSIDGAILVLIFAMLLIGAALENTGAVELVVGALTPYLALLAPMLVLACVHFTASILTELVTNNAVAVVLTPIVIALGQQLGIDPTPLVVSVMIGASASFATPIGYQTNTLVYGAGNYRFTDFLKIGVPMNVIAGITSILVIPIFFPF